MNAEKKMNDTLFLDRDGVVNVQLEGDYVKAPDELILRDDFLCSIPLLKRRFRRFIIVTNQQGVAKGICTMEQVDEVHRFLRGILRENGFELDAIYVCPHHANEGCPCRKPGIGMAQQAQRDFPDLDFSRCVMIGDKSSDMLFGRRAGMKTVYIGTVDASNEAEIRSCADIITPSIYQYALSL
ncbi:MAG: HAD family hydrolase [Bacteroidales bacterium]|nr:HAD family hydrolase [Bacteroidales bacterium]